MVIGRDASQAETVEEYHDEMRVLVVGSGAREHALCWRLKNSPSVQKVYAWPGNPGIAQVARVLESPEPGVDAYDELARWAGEKRIDLTVVGPELHLCNGIVDVFERRGLRCFGPDSSSARIEGSKTYAKILMDEAGIPTARSQSFADVRHAKRFAQRLGGPWVIKADGLAGGKGTLICATLDEAYDAIERNLKDKIHGDASRQVLVEECLTGQEISVMAVTDGQTFQFLPIAQDHKRLLDGDRGPNTGGMGAYAPVPFVDDALVARIGREIFDPLLKKLHSRRMPYRGVLNAGIMLTAEGPRVLEFNCRLGDPEAQCILPLIESDLAHYFLAACEGHLNRMRLRIAPRHAVCVVLASRGYPTAPRVGMEIRNVDMAAGGRSDRFIFHAGTAVQNKRLVTSGGRVLSVVGLGNDLGGAIDAAYGAVRGIQFDGAVMRTDIAQRSLRLNVTQTGA